MPNKTWLKEVAPINGPEDLRKITRASDIDIVQLRPGKLQGSILHFGIGNLEISVGQFNSGIRLRGCLSPERVAIGIILDSAGRITEWWKDVQPGDVGVFPARAELDEIHEGGAAYLVVSIALRDLLSKLEGENRLGDPSFWSTKHLCQVDPCTGGRIRRQFQGIMADVGRNVPSVQAMDFLQRTIIEGFVVSLLKTLPPESEESGYTGPRLVSEVEDYVDAAGERPVHISELSRALKVSRRSLERAFCDTVGMGPVAYLRRRRLSIIRSALMQSDPTAKSLSIGDLAFEHGFPESGRFAAYYRAQFGELPSETCRSKSVRIRTSLCSVVDLTQTASPAMD